jgi:uncharacterized membrane protein
MRHPSADTLAQVMLWMGVLIGLVVLGVLIVQRFRGGTTDSTGEAKELVANFEEMHSRGDITEADYRKIKSVLGNQLHVRLKDDNHKV